MEYISTRNNKKTFTFEEVFLKGLAPDGGLFIPKSITTINLNYFSWENSFLFEKYFFQAQLPTANRTNAEIITVKAIFPPLLSVIQTVQR